jgi:uncharacterized protein (TIGR01319 family)
MEASGKDKRQFTYDSPLFCITDVGSTTTKAILFEKKVGKWRFFRQEAPTTVERPHEDVSIGVLAAMRALEEETGHPLVENGSPCVPYLSTSSAGGGLAMVVTGLVRDLTADSADRVALGAGAIVLDVIAMNDGRTPYRKIQDLRLLRPDMVLLAGGFDGDNLSGPVFLAELMMESDLHPKLSAESRLDLIYGGNVKATDYVAEVLAGEFEFHTVPNVRPSGDHENFEPARRLIHDLFMDHVMSKAPGYHKIKSWVSAPIRPTPAAFGHILGQVSRDLDKSVLAIDLGGATTDVFSAVNGRVFRTVSANLGMSYSIRNVAELGGIESIKQLHPAGLGETELWNRIGNKHLNPTRLPGTREDMLTEWAVATIAIREAVKEHLQVMERAGDEVAELRPDIDDLIRGPRRDWRKELRPEGRIELELQDYDLVIGSGGILSHSPREAAAMILTDALQPGGAVELAVDSAFMFPHLGVLAEMNADLASRLFYDLGIVRLGTVYSPSGTSGPGPLRIGARASSGRSIEETISDHEVRAIELSEEEALSIVQAGEAGEHTFTVRGGTCGLIVDTRPRPIETGAESLLKGAYVPKAARAADREETVVKGAIRLRRELAIPGEVFVDKGDDVGPDTLVARSARQFLRPFFIEIAHTLGVSAEETEGCLVKGVGDEIGIGDLIAKRPRKGLSFKTVRSNVRARIERILPNGTLVARELPELAREYTTVKVAEDLGKPAWQMKPFLRVEPGDPVERGQWLAADVGPRGIKYSASPVRGKVNRIDHGFGMVIIEPLLEELEVRAWLPGKVAEVSDRGCVVAGRGTIIRGIWGLGGETSGTITLGEPGPGTVVVRHSTDASLLQELGESDAAGLVTGGLDLRDMLGAEPAFTIVVTEGFGNQEIRPEAFRLFEAYEGKLGLLDGTTQLRVGVRRPRVILPAV